MIYLIILFVILIVGYFYTGKHDEFFATDFFHDGYGASVAYGVTMVILGTMIIAGGAMHLQSIGEVAGMEAFYDNTLSVYEYTVDKSEDITINAIKDAEEDMTELFNTGNLAYFELAKSVNSNLVELRESIRIYNKGLYSYRKYNSFWFTDSFVCNVPGRLSAIKLK